MQTILTEGDVVYVDGYGHGTITAIIITEHGTRYRVATDAGDEVEAEARDVTAPCVPRRS